MAARFAAPILECHWEAIVVPACASARAFSAGRQPGR